MDWFAVLAEITKHTLSIIDTKVSRKFVEEVIELERRKRDEESKPRAERNHALLDNIDFELCLIAKTTTGLKGSTITN